MTFEDFNPQMTRFLKYLDFKVRCIKYQQDNPIRMDMDLAVKCRDELISMQAPKIEELKEVMPKVKRFKWQTKPKSTHKKDGTLSVAGSNWYSALKENGISPASRVAKESDRLKVFSHWEEPNPKSPEQVKEWLFSLGWKPCTFDYKKNDDGSDRLIPQIRKNGELTPSVLRLKDKTPEVEILEGLTIIQHRLGIFQGFIGCALEVRDACGFCQDGLVQSNYSEEWPEFDTCQECEGLGYEIKYYLRAEIGGLTNTLRFKHKKPLVNLPGVDKPWGKEIRGCLIADDGEVFIGADMTSLEDTTKRHYMKPLDPDYVEEMSQPGYDPHLALALFQGEITQEEYDFYVWYENQS